jgi:hypothetical protein
MVESNALAKSTEGLFDFADTTFRYEPYPIGFARGVLPRDLYQSLTDSYPTFDQLKLRPSLGNKYILTEFDGSRFHDFIAAHSPWRRFYDYVKSPDFINFMLDFLMKANVDLALRGIEIVEDNGLQPGVVRLSGKVIRKFRQVMPFSQGRHMHLTSRFEFGAFPGVGGSQFPHTDTPRKVISLVLSMVKEGEWDPGWGGGTAVVRPKDPTKNFNFVNRYLGFEDVEVLEEFPFMPNCCVIFVKTFNSWHAVMPIHASAEKAVRKTVVINVDLIGAPGTGTDY